MFEETPKSKHPETTDDESTSVIDGGEIENTTGTTPCVAKSLSTLISSIITDFDSRAEATARSQDYLSSSLDRLIGELDQLLDDAPLPFMMQHAARISGVRKRVTSLNTVLKSIQRRVDNIDRMLSAGLAHGELQGDVSREGEGQPS